MNVSKEEICLCPDLARSRTAISARNNVSSYEMTSVLVAVSFILFWISSSFRSIRGDEALTGPDLQLWGVRGSQNAEAPISNNKLKK
jgi:hypothetical protein